MIVKLIYCVKCVCKSTNKGTQTTLFISTLDAMTKFVITTILQFHETFPCEVTIKSQIMQE